MSNKVITMMILFFISKLAFASEMSTSSSSSSSSSSFENIEQVVLECKKNALEKLDKEIKKLEEANPNLKEVDKVELVKLSDKKLFYYHYLLNKIKDLVKRNRFKEASDVIKKFNKQNSVLVLPAIVYYLDKITEVTSKQLSNIIGFPEDISTIINSYVEPYEFTEIKTLNDCNDLVYSIAWSPNGEYLASGSNYSRIIIWNTNTWKKFTTLHSVDNVSSIVWSPGPYLASISYESISDKYNKIIIWNTGTKIKTLESHNNWVYSIAWSYDGLYLASASSDHKIIIWDTSTNTLRKIITLEDYIISSAVWSPCGKYLALYSGCLQYLNSYSRYSNQFREYLCCPLIILNTNTWEIIKTLTYHEASVNLVAWSSDSRYLASASSDDKIIIWDTNTWEIIKTLTYHKASVKLVAWSPDGKYLASASSDHTIIIWNTNTWENIKTLEKCFDKISSIAWSPDGKYLASVSDDQLKIWGKTYG